MDATSWVRWAESAERWQLGLVVVVALLAIAMLVLMGRKRGE